MPRKIAYKYDIRIMTGMPILLKELGYWGVSPDRYEVTEDNHILTSDNNVVDVVTETFIDRLDWYDIVKTSARKRREPEYGIEMTRRPKRRVKGRDVPEAEELEILENKPLARRVQKVVDAFTEIENITGKQADAIKRLKEKYAPMIAEQEEAVRAQQPYIEEELAIPADEAASALYRVNQYTVQVIQLLQQKMEVIRTPNDAQKLQLVLASLEQVHPKIYKEITKLIESAAAPDVEELPGAREMAIMPTLEKHKAGWSIRVKEADIGEWVGKGWDWIQEQVSNFTSAVGDFLNNIWPLEQDLQEAIVELEAI